MSIDHAQFKPGDIANGHQLSADGTTWVPIATTDQRNWFARHKILTGVGGSVAALALLVAVTGGSGAETTTNSDPVAAVDQPATTEDAASAAPEITRAQENALRAAKNYLEFMSFSEQGLIDQLSSEYGDGFSLEDATWAVSQLEVDWNEQAVRSAEQYLEISAFSRAGLIDQLSSEFGSQFTVEQATYAADAVGL